LKPLLAGPGLALGPVSTTSGRGPTRGRAQLKTDKGPRPARPSGPWSANILPVYTFFGVLQVIISAVLIFLVLLHSGKDAGLSGAFGIGGGGSAFGGGSMVERNLDRATVFFAVLFVLNTFLLLKIS
jgi:preprotein translocase subunit SecG